MDLQWITVSFGERNNTKSTSSGAVSGTHKLHRGSGGNASCVTNASVPKAVGRIVRVGLSFVVTRMIKLCEQKLSTQCLSIMLGCNGVHGSALKAQARLSNGVIDKNGDSGCRQAQPY